MSSAMNIDEFIRNVMSAMRLNDIESCPDEGIEARLVKAFNYLERLSVSKGIELRFYCKLNVITNESPSVRYALIRAEQSGLIARDGQNWNIMITKEEAASNLAKCPVSKEEWRQVSMKMESQPFSSLLAWFD